MTYKLSKISKRTASYSNKLHNSPKNSRVQKETITTKKKKLFNYNQWVLILRSYG